MVKTVQELMRKKGKGGAAAGGHDANNTKPEGPLWDQYEKRLQNLEAEVGKARQHTKDLSGQLEEQKKKNGEERKELESVNATVDDLLKDRQALHSTMDQVKEANEDLVADK